MNDTVSVAVVGYGYWGPNMVRNLFELGRVDLRAICDQRESRRALARARYPSVEAVDDYQRLVEDESIDAIVLTTPVSTHYPLARRALESGKHVLVAKPLAASVAEAEALVKLAQQHRRVLMVDHTFLYTGAVRKLKQLMLAGEIGELYYFDSVRVNLGLFQPDVSVVWDLAAHDVSLMRYLLGRSPIAVSATGIAHFDRPIEDVAYITAWFDERFVGHIHVSWLSPVKIRQTLIAGSKRMVVYNDNEPSEKVKIYDRGIEFTETPLEAAYELLVTYRTGDVHIPRLDTREALHVECEEFVDAILGSEAVASDGDFGLDVVRVLEAAQQSVAKRGEVVRL